jgi:23S rRNA (uracil-5-)-methyltransferase RumA
MTVERKPNTLDPRRVAVEKLAPTGEGIVRAPGTVGFVAGALPGEEVEVDVVQVRKKFWKGRAVRVLVPAAERRKGPHEECAGCDWAFFDLDAARRAKRDLFLETMDRLGGLEPEVFGDLILVPSPARYRIRVRFHVGGRGAGLVVGYYAPRTHRVEPAERCEALSDEMRKLLPRLAESMASSGAAVSQVFVAEDFGGARVAQVVVDSNADRSDAHALEKAMESDFQGVTVVAQSGERMAAAGTERLWLTVRGRDFPITAGSFFQVNRHLVGQLYDDVAQDAARLPRGSALDAFGGVGFFAGALLDAGHRVVSVESSSAAVDLATQAKKHWNLSDEGVWRIIRSPMLPYVRSQPERVNIAVVDPPRAGLGIALARALADHVRNRVIYVSCEPATLARDLAVIQSRGFRVTRARLYDLFAFTHRIEAVVTLERRSDP